MKNTISTNNYFDDFDFENAPMIKQLQENKGNDKKTLQNFLTEIEVKKWDMKDYKQVHG